MQDLFSTASARLEPELKDYSDMVLWTAFNARGQERGKWVSTNCYQPIMHCPGSYEIHCRAWPRGAPMFYSSSKYQLTGEGNHFEGRASALQYARFMGLCARHKIFLPGVKIFTDPQYGNGLVIPRKDWDRHTVYVLLCLYRWQDVRARTMYTTLALLDYLRQKGQFLPFLQCLHYVVAHQWQKLGDGHGFLPVGWNHAKNPAVGWAWAHFNRLPLEDRQQLTPKSYTVGMFSQLAQKVNPAKLPRDWNDEPGQHLESITELLHPRFSPLYTHPEQFGPEEFRKLLEEK